MPSARLKFVVRGALALAFSFSGTNALARDPAEVALLPKGIASLHDRLHMLRKCGPGDAFYFTTYWISQDEVSRTFLHEFAEATSRGCHVRGIVDPFHERLPARYHDFLRARGIELREFRPIRFSHIFRYGFNYVNNRIHDKLWVLDPGGAQRMYNTSWKNLPERPPGQKAEVIAGSSNLLGESFRANLGAGLGSTSARNNIEIDFLARGEIADQVLRYHHYVWNSGNTVKRESTASADSIKETARWVEQGHRELLAKVGLTAEMMERAPARIFRDANVTFFHDLFSRNRAPENSEEAVFTAIRRARRGDYVRIAGRDVLFTPQLFENLQKVKPGDFLFLGDGQKVPLTPEVLAQFAAATPADDIVFSNQYFILTPDLERELAAARAKGVRVRFVTNAPDNQAAGKPPRLGYLHTFDRAVAVGVEIYEHTGPDVLHAKVIVRRNVKEGFLETTIGTSNIDPRSLEQHVLFENGRRRHLPILRNLEVNFRLEGAEIAEDVGRQLETQLALSRLVARGGKSFVTRDCGFFYRWLLNKKSIFNLL